ncbi:MAG TPA: hypothetical protein VFR15_12100 [Chloroflexia bacterium]|nr:hypothetical protein [Chloroflexia bacterium]
MPNPYDYEPISVVEDLDPEPQGADRRRRLGELVLGLILLIGVLGWGGWQWWRDTTMQEAYRAGSEAAERRDWDAARDSFRQASGYRDADTRAGDAARLAERRDELYGTATRAMDAGRPLEAYRATNELRTVQPDYRDTEELHRRALQGAINNAVAGGAVNGLAPLTPIKPGLYVGLENGTIRLEGSDQSSLVRAGTVDGPPGCAVYDAPSPGGRSLRLACVEAGGVVRTEPLDAGFQPDDFDRYVGGTGGAWGLTVAAAATPIYQGTDTQEIERRNRLQGALLGYDVKFLPAGGRAVSYRLPEPNWIVMALGDHGGMLLAESVELDRGRPGMALYLVRPGVAPGLLYRQEGGFIAAHFSPDEHYVLLSSYAPLAGRGEEHRLVLVDTSTGEARVLASGTSYSERQDPVPHVGGAFVRGGPLDGKVVAIRWAYEGSIMLVDPERPDEPLAALPVSGYPGSRVYAAGSPEGIAVVGWQAVNVKGRGPTLVETAVLRPGRESTIVEGPLPEGETLWSVAMRGDNVAYIARRTGYPVNRRGPVIIRSLHAPEGMQASEARVLYTEPLYDWSQMSARAARPAFSWHLGKEGVTYSQDGLLQVAPFDGGPPVTLTPAMEPLPFTGWRRSEWVR